MKYVIKVKASKNDQNKTPCIHISLQCCFHYLLFQDSVVDIKRGNEHKRRYQKLSIYVRLMYVCNPKLSINNEVF